MGYSPRSLAAHLDMFVSSSNLRARPCDITIGNHTHHHYPLGRLSDHELKSEIVGCHRILSELLRKPPNVFAYPFGVPNDKYFDERGKRTLEEIGSYQCIFSNAPSSNRKWEYGRVEMDGISVENAVFEINNVRWKTIFGY